jgi:1-acyl-sn-glycerol-3-phosphate acyltransferase
VKVKVTGMEKLGPGRPYVFVSNHQSYFDVLCLIGHTVPSMRFMAKKELVYVPIFGQLMWAAGHIVIDRKRHDKSRFGVQKAGEKIREGTSVLVFAEGTRSPDHVLGPFKKGGFILALEAGVPVVPVSIAGTRPMMAKGKFTFTKSDIMLVVGDPIPVEDPGPDDREELMDRVRAAMIWNFPRQTPEFLANRSDPVLEKFPAPLAHSCSKSSSSGTSSMIPKSAQSS